MQNKGIHFPSATNHKSRHKTLRNADFTKKRKPEASIQSVLSAIDEKKTAICRNETPKEFIETAKEKILSPFR